MLESIEVQNFKSLRDVRIALGTSNYFLGTNASGKSNFLDALRVFQGIGFGYTIEEIFNGKPRTSPSDSWTPIRGGSKRATFEDSSEPCTPEDARTIGLTATFTTPGGTRSRQFVYSVRLSAQLPSIRSERLVVDGAPIFDSERVENPAHSPVLRARYYQKGKLGQPRILDFEKTRSILHQLEAHERVESKHHRNDIKSCINHLLDMQRIDPVPSVLREYSMATSVLRMGEHGENFAALVRSICADEKTKLAYLSWLRQLTPSEAEDVKSLDGAIGDSLFALRERGVWNPAPILSDGTLRFAAIAAAFFQPSLPRLLTIEEIENGIHPTRLRLLVELLRARAGADGTQVMATTHSPIVLSWLRPEDYSTTFLCTRNEETGESVIRSLAELPRFQALIKKQPIGGLFAEGWLEGAL